MTLGLKNKEEQRAEQLKPLIGNLVITGGLLVSLIGVCGVIGSMLGNNFLRSFTPEVDVAIMALPTAIAFIFLGIGMITILDTRSYESSPHKLWPVRVVSILVPGGIGLGYVLGYLMTPQFDWLNLSTYGLLVLTFYTAGLLTLAGIALSIFLAWRSDERAVVYGICIPAFMVFNVGILGIVGHIYHAPLLYGSRMALSTAIGATFIGLTFMIATLPVKGIWLPVLSPQLKARNMAIFSGAFGVGALFFGMNLIAVFLHINELSYGGFLSLGLKHLLSGAIYACHVTAITILIIGLRASRYYSQTLQYTQEQTQHALRQQQAVEELRLSQQRFEVLVNNIKNNAIFTLNPSGFITSWGKGPEEVLLYKPEEVIGRHFSMFSDASEKGKLELELELARARKYGHAEVEGWRFKKGGLRFWANSYSTALRDKRGHLLGFIKVIRDVTERREADERIRTIMDSNLLGMFFWNKSGKITEANNAFLHLLGYNQADLSAGRINWREITPPEYQDQDQQCIEQMFEDPQGKCTPYEKQFLNKENGRVDVLVAGALFPNQRSSGVAFVLEMTELKQTEQALLDSQQQLQESNRDLAHFATIASHDLKAPLRKVSIFYDMIQKEAQAKLSPEAFKILEKADQSITTMQGLISDLLSWSQIANTQPVFEKVDLAQVLHTVQENLEAHIQESRAEIIIDGPMPVVRGNEALLIQLIQNLVENGLKYQPEGQIPIINIASDCFYEQFCKITVKDNGIGFKAESTEKIFKPFQRLHGKSSPYKGSGIGLSICQRIVERHGGSIRVESQVGKGSSFQILLPVKKHALQLQLTLGLVKPFSSKVHRRELIAI